MFNEKDKGLRILEEARKIATAALDKDEVVAEGGLTGQEEYGVIFL